MAIDVIRDIFEPTQRAIEQIERERTCSYCKAYNKGFSVKDNVCNCCGAPGPEKRKPK